jgi:hypothetical protein
MADPYPEKKTTFHPQIEEAFDAAQEKPLQISNGGDEYAALSVAHFEDILKEAHFDPQDITFQRVDRGEKPDVIIMKKSTFLNLSEVINFFQSKPGPTLH